MKFSGPRPAPAQDDDERGRPVLAWMWPPKCGHTGGPALRIGGGI